MSNEERETKMREEGDEEKEESKEMGGKVLSTKTNNQLAKEDRREILIASVKDIPYPLVPSNKERE